ncbi:MAG: aldehyde dehydrogenase family protein [Desulfobacterium sp.]|nr:aldehyde dehydrogenase family protein [Desulfobacterium sp.]
MKTYNSFYINGKWVKPDSKDTFTVINPCNESVVATVAMGNAVDVDIAVKAAHSAFASWSKTPVVERADILSKISDALADRQDEIGDTIALEMGMPSTWARMIQAGLPISTFASFSEILKDYPFEYAQGTTQIIKEPIGVCGFITPWNYPLHQIAGKVAPALAAGCTMVLKPSRFAPLNAFILAEIMEQVGVPPGVFNLVCGSGSVVGNAITTHTDVDMLSLTGSTASGVRVAQAGALTIKRVTLELGGKSANILLDDADFEFAVPEGVNNCFLNSGQTCSALTRMLVPADRQSEVIAMAKSEAESMVIGDAFDDDVFIGPLVDAEQQRSVRDYIRKGISEGATLVTGGPEPVNGLEKGFYVKPTIFADVTSRMTIAREEIFGPVLCIIPYKTEAEAIQIANDSLYGLSGSVWSANIERAKQVAKQIRTGQVFINGAGFDVHAPFGGYKQSGNGRERSKYGLEEFLEIKAIMGYHPVL